MRVVESNELVRCAWAASGSPEEIAYHDEEWGVPSFDDRYLFEMLILEGAQAGLSWSTVLKKREGYRDAFDGFDAKKIARYDEAKIQALLENPGIIRNRLKVRSAVTNAQAYLDILQREGGFAEYIWRFVGGEPIRNYRKSLSDLPVSTEESDAMSKDLKNRGFKFVGSTICYAYMQAVGMVNDHTCDCFLYSG